MMLYPVTAYAVMSLIQIQPVWRQRFEPYNAVHGMNNHAICAR